VRQTEYTIPQQAGTDKGWHPS